MAAGLVLAAFEFAARTTNQISGVKGGGGGGGVRSTGAAVGRGAEDDDRKPMKLLHIVTTLSEYNTGLKMTRAGQDRLKDILIPVLKDGVESMTSHPYGYDVDVYLILGFELRPERRKLVVDALPDGVGLEVWDDACPLAYDGTHNKRKTKLTHVTRTLARQHRYVIKDKLFEYDFFVVFEDDMRITGEHVDHFLAMSNEIRRLKESAPESLPERVGKIQPELESSFHGAMTKGQLDRMIPGFVRVEVLLDEATYGSQTNLGSVPVDRERNVDPAICCHVPNVPPGGDLPIDPPSEKLVMWEYGIDAASVREMPEGSSLGWVVLQAGPDRPPLNDTIGGYWSGTSFAMKSRPRHSDPKFLANQGGWMLHRDQILDLHLKHCKGGFLPPFDLPTFEDDGLYRNNVEYYSGGIQMFTPASGCNLQRFIPLDPDHFSRQLLYHTSNNKQRTSTVGRERLAKANDLLGQLNAVRKAADLAKTG